MTTLTLLVKASNLGQVKQIDELLKTQFSELDVEVEVSNNTANRWVQVLLSGEDEAVATSYINKEIGTCPSSLENAKNYPVLRGYISKLDTTKQELSVDVGIFEPKVVLATVSLANLQTQLVEGRNTDLKKIAEIYGLVERSPLSIKLVSAITGEVEGLQGELAEEQVERLHSWQQSLLDRLIILGASLDKIENVLERTRLNRDVIEIETLGMFEHSLTCKLGTNAAGLVSIVGRYLRNSIFVVFNAKKSLDFMDEQKLTS
ncbi:DUF2110 family protein [Candidatus Bathyarchaeota archaeon]|nr:MAG: DUF2110 family protein [Candidatus Bathyarchaeota archaeon]